MTIRSIVFFLAFCMAATQFLACNKSVTTPSASLPITATSIAGSFTVGSFVTVVDQTATFDGFQFAFNENGMVTAKKDSLILMGTWQFDDSDTSEMKLNFSDAPLTELNKGWHIEDLTNHHMLLTDDGKPEDMNDDNPQSSSKLEFERD